MRNVLPLLFLLSSSALGAAAQARPTGDSLPTPGRNPVRAEDFLPKQSKGFLEVGIGAGALALLSVADRPARDEVQGYRTAGGDDLARAFKHFGEPVVYAPVALGTVAVGLLTGKESVTRAGGRITAGLLVAGISSNLLKPLLGRRRPRFSDGAYEFDPLSGQDSWPSGHTTMAFALATSVSDEVGSFPLTVGLYGAATLTGWSRVNDDRHWLSDVAAGALLGITSAKLMNGRWRLFGLGAPRFLLEPGKAGVMLEF